MKRRPRITRRQLASELPSELQHALVIQRITRARCLECGGPRYGGAEFCPSCSQRFPITHDLGFNGSVLVLDGWRYVVIQRGPLAGFGHFDALRVGIFEREGQARPIGMYFQTFEEAREAALAAHSRSLRSLRALGWVA